MTFAMNQAISDHLFSLLAKTKHELNVIDDAENQQRNSERYEGGTEIARWRRAAVQDRAFLELLKKLENGKSKTDER
jgi:hypothetical protein